MSKKIILIGLCLCLVLLAGCVGKPKVGDCVDVTKYGDSETVRYCKITGYIHEYDIGTYTTYAFGLDETNCEFTVCSFDDEIKMTKCHILPLGGANSIDGKLVSDNFCDGVDAGKETITEAELDKLAKEIWEYLQTFRG